MVLLASLRSSSHFLFRAKFVDAVISWVLVNHTHLVAVSLQASNICCEVWVEHLRAVSVYCLLAQLQVVLFVVLTRDVRKPLRPQMFLLWLLHPQLLRATCSLWSLVDLGLASRALLWGSCVGRVSNCRQSLGFNGLKTVSCLVSSSCCPWHAVSPSPHSIFRRNLLANRT